MTNARGAGALVGNDGSPVRLVRVVLNLDLRLLLYRRRRSRYRRGLGEPRYGAQGGERLLVVPLELSVQVHPWAEKSRGGIATLRGLVGFRMGL